MQKGVAEVYHKLTPSSETKGEQWQTHSFTDTQTGNATPRRTTLPALFLFLKIAAVLAWMNSSPNLQMSTILAPGVH